MPRRAHPIGSAEGGYRTQVAESHKACLKLVTIARKPYGQRIPQRKWTSRKYLIEKSESFPQGLIRMVSGQSNRTLTPRLGTSLERKLKVTTRSSRMQSTGVTRHLKVASRKLTAFWQRRILRRKRLPRSSSLLHLEIY